MFSKPTKTKKIEQTGKNLETCFFEQKSMEIDIFNDEEEKEIKERVEKRVKMQEIAEKKTLLKRGKKAEQKKEDDKEMWERLRKINKKFKDIKEAKKSHKKGL